MSTPSASPPRVSLASDLAEITTTLARLGSTRPGVESTRDGLDAALHARTAVLALCRQVIIDLRVAPSGRVPSITDLHVQPLAALAWSLRHHPHVAAERSPIDVARNAARGSLTAAWEQTATLATRTHLRWEAADLSTATSWNPARPALLGDVALTAAALTHCEPAMAGVAVAIGDHERAARLQASLALPLRPAAEAAWRHPAHQGPAWDITFAPPARRLPVLPVRAPEDVPDGLRRLAGWLTSGVPVSPQHTAVLLSAQARIARAAAASAPTIPTGVVSTGPPGLSRARLSNYAHLLASAWSPSDGALTSLTPSDPRLVHQARECVRALAAGAPSISRPAEGRVTTGPLPEPLVLRLRSALDATLVATCAAIEHQLDQHTWAIARSNDDLSPGAPARVLAPLEAGERPAVLAALHRVRDYRHLRIHRPRLPRLTTAEPTDALTSGPARPPAAAHVPGRSR